MKLVKTIIAFVSIYCFITMIVGTLFVCRFLNTFTPSLTGVPIFTVTIDSIKSGEQCKIRIKSAPYSGFTTLFSATPSTNVQQERVLPCKEYTLVLSSFNIPKPIIPIVYSDLYKYRGVSPDEKQVWLTRDATTELLLANASVANLFGVKPTLLFIQLPLASETPTQYSIVENESGVIVLK